VLTLQSQNETRGKRKKILERGADLSGKKALFQDVPVKLFIMRVGRGARKTFNESQNRRAKDFWPLQTAWPRLIKAHPVSYSRGL